MLGDRVLRHAMVKVSTGKAVSKEEQDDAEPMIPITEEPSMTIDNSIDA